MDIQTNKLSKHDDPNGKQNVGPLHANTTLNNLLAMRTSK